MSNIVFLKFPPYVPDLVDEREQRLQRLQRSGLLDLRGELDVKLRLLRDDATTFRKISDAEIRREFVS